MSVKPCRDCGKEASTEAEHCPHCGASAPTREKSGDWVPCTKCGSAGTRKTSTAGSLMATSFVCLMASVFCFWAISADWFTGGMEAFMMMINIGLFVTAIVSPIGAVIAAIILSRKVSFQCQSCEEQFTIQKSELKKSGSIGAGP